MEVGLWVVRGLHTGCYCREHGIMEIKNKLAERKAFDDSMTNVATCARYVRRLRLFS